MTNFPTQSAQAGKRRRYDPVFKAMIIERCQQPEISIASVAQEFGLNANLIHKWIHRVRRKGEIATYPGFVPVPLDAAKSADTAATPMPETAPIATIEISSKLGTLTLRCSEEQSIRLLKELLS